MVHVFEPESHHVLALSTTKQNYLSGEDIVVKAELSEFGESLPLKAAGYITTPSGEKVHDLLFKTDEKGGFQAVLNGLKGQSLTGGLWEVHTVTETNVNGQKIMRDASTAFAVNLASAQFSGELSVNRGQLNFGIQNVLAARYEISGTLLGHDEKGQKQPIALMMVAQWLEAGQTSLSFDWPVGLVKSSGLKPPFVISQLALKNQSSMVPVQRMEAGVEISALPVELTDIK